jgi:hypothetical protein
MDYDLEIVLIALVAHRRFEGGGESRVSRYATDLFARFDSHIQTAGTAAGRALSAKERSVIASIAAMVGGTPQGAAEKAVASYVNLFSS